MFLQTENPKGKKVITTVLLQAEMMENLDSKISEAEARIELELSSVKKSVTSYQSNLEFINCLEKYAKPIERLDLEKCVEERLSSISQVVGLFIFWCPVDGALKSCAFLYLQSASYKPSQGPLSFCIKQTGAT